MKARVKWRSRDLTPRPQTLRHGLGVGFVELASEQGAKLRSFIDKFCDIANKLEEAVGAGEPDSA